MKLQLTVCSYADKTREFVLERIADISRGIALSAGVPEEKLPSGTIRDEYTPVVFNDPAFMSTLETLLTEILGSEHLQTVDPVMAGEDFSRYGRIEHDIPGALLWLGAVEPAAHRKARELDMPLPGLHSARFAPDAKHTLDTGITKMWALLQALFYNKS